MSDPKFAACPVHKVQGTAARQAFVPSEQPIDPWQDAIQGHLVVVLNCPLCLTVLDTSAKRMSVDTDRFLGIDWK